MERILVISSVLLWGIVLFNLLLLLAVIRRLNVLPAKASPPRLISLAAGLPAPPFEAATQVPSFVQTAVVKRIVALECEIYTIPASRSALEQGQDAAGQQRWDIPSGQIFVCPWVA